MQYTLKKLNGINSIALVNRGRSVTSLCKVLIIKNFQIICYLTIYFLSMHYFKFNKLLKKQIDVVCGQNDSQSLNFMTNY